MKVQLIIIFLFLNCCASPQQLTKRQSEVLTLWKQDSNGCLNDRNVELAKFLRDSLYVQDKDESWINQMLGEPNKRGDSVFTYFFDVRCNSGVVIDSLDYCWLNVNFEDRFASSINIFCN